MTTSTITKDDVLFVASMLNKRMTKDQIHFVVDNFDAEVASDPSGCLPLWIENLIDKSDQLMKIEFADKTQKELIEAMLKFLYKFVEGKDVKASTINNIMDNTHYVEALYLGENECSEHQELHDQEGKKLINFKEAYKTLHSSFINHVL